MILRRSLLAVLVCTALAGAGCTGSRPTLAPASTNVPGTTAVATSTTLTAPGTSMVAQAIPNEVAVYESADASTEPKATLTNPNPNGAPLVFLVKATVSGWYEVYLPIRPNSSTGWVKADDVTVSHNPYRLVVSASDFTLTVYENDQQIRQYPIGIGTDDYPTPGGVFYIKELLQPPNPDGAYGPYAYGLSGFSNIEELANFAGGDGTIGIHGTNDPDSVGSTDSHGCIRMYNDDVTALTEILPLGTPVEIEA